MSDATATSTGGTTALDYSEAYYRHYSDSDEPYAWSSPGWRGFFTNVASRIVLATGPADKVLDVGCAKGMLVQGFVAAGSEHAEGVDISSAAIASADPEVRDRLRVDTATTPFEGRYDLVTCIEVLEHMAPAEAATALDNICAVTDRIVVSSTPGDFDEPTHINVHPVADWAAELAARGFFRRVDIDLSFLSPWAGYFERADLRARDLVHRYEAYQYALRVEVLDKRAALLTTQRELEQLEGSTVTVETPDVSALRRNVLTMRDALIGAEAAAATARQRCAQLEAEVARKEGERQAAENRLQEYARALEEVRASARWKAGGMAVGPLQVAKRAMRGRA